MSKHHLSIDEEQVVRWVDALEELPDADITVLCGFANDEVDLGYYDGTHWRAQSNLTFAERVEFWSHTPAVPTRKKKGATK